MKPTDAALLIFGSIVLACWLVWGSLFLIFGPCFLIYRLIKLAGGYKMIKNPHYLMKFQSENGVETVRILTESEFMAMDTSKIFVMYQLRSTLDHCVKVCNDQGWKQTTF